jgi:hypothetical protein
MHLLARHMEPLPIHEHHQAARGLPIRCGAAVPIEATTLALLVLQIPVDVVSLDRQRQADGDNSRNQSRSGKHVMLPTLGS